MRDCPGDTGERGLCGRPDDRESRPIDDRSEIILRMPGAIEKVILPDIPGLQRIDVYEELGGYRALKKAVEMKPDEIIDQVKKSNLRGRGGACFPTGLKWSFMPKQSAKPKYLCANGDESEPGTFKDRQIFEFNPHVFIEGSIIAACAMGIRTIYVYVRGEYKPWITMLQKAVDDAYRRNFLGSAILGSHFGTDMVVVRGAGAYLCGEESAVMNSLEGDRG